MLLIVLGVVIVLNRHRKRQRLQAQARVQGRPHHLPAVIFPPVNAAANAAGRNHAHPANHDQGYIDVHAPSEGGYIEIDGLPAYSPPLPPSIRPVEPPFIPPPAYAAAQEAQELPPKYEELETAF